MPRITFRVLLLTADDRLAGDAMRVCARRRHPVGRIGSVSELQQAMTGARRPRVLLLDAGDGVDEAARIAATVAAVHPDLAIVLAAAGAEARSVNGFRLVDRERDGERVVDELELACIGIPPSIDEWFAMQGSVHP
jgi:hypothetical protein